jgi:hypothetical protein
MRIDFGVISTSSSSAMNSTAYSSVSWIGGVILIASSLPETEVRELLAAHRVDHQVVVARMNADDHALVERVARLHEHAAAIVELAERIGHRLAVVLADEDAVLAPLDLALVKPRSRRRCC